MKIKCLICKKEYTRPLVHVWQKHGITSIAYKQRFGLDLGKSITTEEDKEIMREHALKHLDTIKKNFEKGKDFRFLKGKFNNYKRSPETMERLKKHWEIVANRKGTPVRVEKIKILCANCGKEKMIYPRYFKENNNYCGMYCRNIANNQKRSLNKRSELLNNKNK